MPKRSYGLPTLTDVHHQRGVRGTRRHSGLRFILVRESGRYGYVRFNHLFSWTHVHRIIAFTVFASVYAVLLLADLIVGFHPHFF